MYLNHTWNHVPATAALATFGFKLLRSYTLRGLKSMVSIKVEKVRVKKEA